MSKQSDREAFRFAVAEWLTANGVDVANVSIKARASIADGMLTVPVWVRDANGNLQRDPSAADGLVSRTVTVAVTVPPTPEVELWLTPRCETCGR